MSSIFRKGDVRTLFYEASISPLQSKNNTSHGTFIFAPSSSGRSVTIIKPITHVAGLSLFGLFQLIFFYRPNNADARLSAPPIMCNRSSSTIDVRKVRGLSGRFEDVIIKWNNDAIGRQQKCFSVRDLGSQREGNL